MSVDLGLVKPSEAARFFNISERHLRTLRKRGIVRPVDVLGKKCVRYSWDELHRVAGQRGGVDGERAEKA